MKILPKQVPEESIGNWRDLESRSRILHIVVCGVWCVCVVCCVCVKSEVPIIRSDHPISHNIDRCDGGWLAALRSDLLGSHSDYSSRQSPTDSLWAGRQSFKGKRSAMNSSLVLILLVAIASIQVNAFLPSSLKASTIFKQLSTRLQFKNFDEMLEQLEVPVLVDFYGDYSIWRLYPLSTAKMI